MTKNGPKGDLKQAKTTPKRGKPTQNKPIRDVKRVKTPKTSLKEPKHQNMAKQTKMGQKNPKEATTIQKET